ncbi:MAG: tol-pal system protein YbgF [Dokdonella sp.]
MAAVVACAIPAQAQQRLSLGERVDRLEQQAGSQSNKGNAVDLINQISELQSQVQSLQGQVEELKHSLDESKQRSKDQYIDLDSRIGRLEGQGAGASAPAAGRGAAQVTQPADIDLGNPGNTPARRDTVNPARNNAGDGLSAADQAAMPADGGANASANPAVTPGDAAAETTAYNAAFAALKDGRYAESARSFQSFIDQYPNGQLTGNAYYWLGESYYVTQNYKVAEQSFRTLLKRYADSQKAPDALLKVGYCQYELKEWDQAEMTLSQVVQTYPDTTVARLAQGRLRALKTETRR